ncbi:unnamed protein product [Oppiella nova]|uniref:Uncharacterized protein n=1 Tax=Oppiella nova TaxID=334625 RepID=A0A7R9LX00_9ACAR|nr:unnamed protein product [Oppiella nova]CAG2167103.1 unnamed protein product [Oppiella nova]
MFAIYLLALIAFINTNAFHLIENNDIYDEVRDSRNFTGKVVLLTGSSSGIGEQTVKLFSALGASVVVTGRNASQVETVVQEVQQLSPQKLKPLGVVADLTKDADIERLFNETIKTFNRLDVLVNNAGVLIQGNGTEKDFLDILDKSLRVDVKASLQLIRLSVPYLQKTKGSVVNIGSTVSERPVKSVLAYDLAKTSLTTISNVLAIELGPQGIRVNTLRIGQPIDIAKGVVFLASSDAEFITGHNLVIDGGLKYNMDSDFNDVDNNNVRDSRNFTGRVVLVTGSSSGIGEQTVKLFSALGASVVVTGRNASQVEAVVKEVQQLSPQKLKPLGVVADLTKDADIERLLNETIKTFNRLDVLVNNAGVLIEGNGTEKDFLDILDKSLRVDVKVSLQLIRLSVPYLQKTTGSVVNIGSIISERPQKSLLAYNLAKTSLTTISNVLAIELGPQGIRVNTLSPGTILKPGTPDKLIKKIVRLTPLGKISQPIDIAKGVVFLASSDAEFITGHNLVIDGGLKYNSDSDVVNVDNNVD